jgi:hypothetical protein
MRTNRYIAYWGILKADAKVNRLKSDVAVIQVINARSRKEAISKCQTERLQPESITFMRHNGN